MEAKARTILLVDDEPVMLLLVEKSIEADGRTFLTATSGRQGLELALRTRPSLIVLDVLMPEMDGLAVCRALREAPETASMPVIMLSAKASRRDLEAGLEAGADAYLTKPFDPSELGATVDRLLS